MHDMAHNVSVFVYGCVCMRLSVCVCVCHELPIKDAFHSIEKPPKIDKTIQKFIHPLLFISICSIAFCVFVFIKELIDLILV